VRGDHGWGICSSDPIARHHHALSGYARIGAHKMPVVAGDFKSLQSVAFSHQPAGHVIEPDAQGVPLDAAAAQRHSPEQAQTSPLAPQIEESAIICLIVRLCNRNRRAG